jgi:hypothetical protein
LEKKNKEKIDNDNNKDKNDKVKKLNKKEQKIIDMKQQRKIDDAWN